MRSYSTLLLRTGLRHIWRFISARLRLHTVTIDAFIPTNGASSRLHLLAHRTPPKLAHTPPTPNRKITTLNLNHHKCNQKFEKTQETIQTQLKFIKNPREYQSIFLVFSGCDISNFLGGFVSWGPVCLRGPWEDLYLSMICLWWGSYRKKRGRGSRVFGSRVFGTWRIGGALHSICV